jgi:hypothetical protein
MGSLSHPAVSLDGAHPVRYVDLIFVMLRLVPGNIADILVTPRASPIPRKGQDRLSWG